MGRLRSMQGWFAKALTLLAAFLLVAAPMTPAVAEPMDCCAGAACHDADKSMCPAACVVACQILPTPEQRLSRPVVREASLPAPPPSSLPPGRAIAPDLPPPR